MNAHLANSTLKYPSSMIHRLLLLLTVAMTCLAGCVATHPKSAALRVGMTKDEALAVMGPPASVAANGRDEYLNYTITETSSDGYRSMIRPYYVRIFDGRVQSFGYSEQINRRLPPPGSAADNPNRFSALKLGMTKEEAIETMGPPLSIAAQGNFEYLNYSVADPNPYGPGATMRPYSVRLLDGKVDAFGLANQIGRTLPTSPAPPVAVAGPRDELRVISVEPATLVPGKSQRVTVKVKYAVQTRAKAVVELLFNLTEAGRFKPVANEDISNGNGEIAMEATITPVDWAAAGQFKVALHLLEFPRIKGQFSRPIVSAEMAVPLGKSP